jgi:hypothetical protein
MSAKMPLDNAQAQDSVVWENTLGLGGSTGDFVKRMSSELRPSSAPSTQTSSFDRTSSDPRTSTAGQDQRARNADLQNAIVAPDTDRLGETTMLKNNLYQGNIFQAQKKIFVAPRDVSFYPLQEWEGYVVDIAGDTFTARLVDKTADKTVEGEVGEFAVSDLTDDDRELLKPGAIFRWTIGYQRTKGGTKRRVSDIVFRRLPQWTKFDLASAKERAKKLADGIRWE